MNKDQLSRIEDKVDKIDARLDLVDVRLEKYNSELEFHIARTNQVEDTLAPISRHVEQMRGAGMLLGLLAVVATIIAGIAALRG